MVRHTFATIGKLSFSNFKCYYLIYHVNGCVDAGRGTCVS